MQACFERAVVFLEARKHLTLDIAVGNRTGQIFLDGHRAFKLVIVGQIDDGKAALADHRDDLELAQPRVQRQAERSCNARGGSVLVV
ncbi:hypothetical protein SDC9_140538 [bioreactor metagenome]|uniref:Uncharacterized protein n=1 Tax=bioreactor metagenome TaxID=1076179 RepID=A0A645DVP0_9ZZZZ